MDKYRLLLGILFVTLSWSCMQTYAQDTASIATTPGANATTPGANATIPGANATIPGANATTPGGNNSTSNAPILAATPAPLAPNTSVETLPTTVNRTDCGTKQLCAAEPSSCDPSTGASCFFLGAQKKDGNNFEFALSGESDGYIAASVLSPFNNKEVTYICANNNNQVKFFGAILEGGKLTLTNVSANSVKGKVNGRKIQCTFLATVPDTRIPAAKRARRATDATLTVSNGTYDASSGSLGAPNLAVKASVSDLAKSNTTVVNEITNSNTTTTLAPGANTTTPGANTTTPGANTTTPGANNSTSTTVPTTTPAPLAPNTSVETLLTTVNRTDCGTKQLCAAEPSTCDPSTGPSCFFLGAQKKDGNNFEFALSGESDGYVAASVLSPFNNKEVMYICANNNNQVKFFGAILEGGKLTLTNVSANTVKGKVNSRKIQCTFLATVPDTRIPAAKRARRATDATLTVSTGTYNASSDNLGAPTKAIQATVADLANPNTTVINEIANSTNATTAPTTTTTTAGSSLADLSRTGCGTQKLCASEPSSCNPATGDTCSFLSAKQKSGQIYSFELSGLSNGYIASAISTDLSAGNGDSTYVCANNNGAVKFITAIFNNKTLTQKSLDYNSGSVQGKINGNRIQCIFEATLTDTTRAAAYSMIIMNGSYSPNSDALGNPFVLLRTNVVNLSDPTANSTNLGSSGVVPRYHPLMQALLVTIGILVLTIFGH